MNISWNIKFCKKHRGSFIPPNPTPSHPIPPLMFYCWKLLHLLLVQKQCWANKIARGGWSGFGMATLGPIPLKSHSNPTRTYSTKLPNMPYISTFSHSKLVFQPLLYKRCYFQSGQTIWLAVAMLRPVVRVILNWKLKVSLENESQRQSLIWAHTAVNCLLKQESSSTQTIQISMTG